MYQLNILRIVWAAWLLLWVFLASGAARRRESETNGSRALHLGLMTGAFALLLTKFFQDGWLASRFVADNPMTAAAGFAIFALGVATSIWSRVLLGRNWSGKVSIMDGHELIELGPYRLVRHPIYAGILVAFVGSAIVVGEMRALIGVALLVIAYLRKIPIEETRLRGHFGSKYSEYEGRTKTLIPFLF